jgi:hypothetical protein
VRRRDVDGDQAAPPRRLLAFHLEDYLPELDPAEAYGAWLLERRTWAEAHGWPRGLDVVDLLREARAHRRALFGWSP